MAVGVACGGTTAAEVVRGAPLQLLLHHSPLPSNRKLSPPIPRRFRGALLPCLSSVVSMSVSADTLSQGDAAQKSADAAAEALMAFSRADTVRSQSEDVAPASLITANQAFSMISTLVLNATSGGFSGVFSVVRFLPCLGAIGAAESGPRPLLPQWRSACCATRAAPRVANWADLARGLQVDASANIKAVAVMDGASVGWCAA